MKCVACKNDANYWCSHCMRHTYCGVSCQRQHRPLHTKVCVPFFFVAGRTSEEDRQKRPRQQGKEQEEEAENAYVRLYTAYKRTKDEKLIPQLEEWFGRMSEEGRRRYVDGLPCHEDRDPVSLEDIKTLEADNVVYLMEGNIKYCYELDALVGYLHSAGARDPIYGRRTPVHPVSRQPFTEEEMHRIDDAAKTRLVTLWSKFRTFTDPVLLSEVMEKLEVMYASYVSADIMQGAKRKRLEKELLAVHTNGLCSYLVQQWPLLRMLDCQVGDVQWERIRKDNVNTLLTIFNTAEDWSSALSSEKFVAFVKEEKRLLETAMGRLFPHIRYEGDPLRELQQLIQRLERFKRYTFRLIISVPNDWTRERTYTVKADAPENLRAEYERVFREGVVLALPTTYHLPWLRMWAGWEPRENSNQLRQYGSTELPWPGDHPEAGGFGLIVLRVIINTGPSVVMHINIPGVPHKVLDLDPNQILYFEQLPEHERRDFMAQFDRYWPSEGHIFDRPDELRTIVRFEAMLGSQTRNDLLSDFTRRGFAFRILKSPPYEDIVRVIKDAVLREHKTNRNGFDTSYLVFVTVEMR